MDAFQALVARQDGDRISASVETLRPSDLPPGEVTIRVLFSSVNVKDVVGVLDRLRAGSYSGRAVVRVAGGF